MHRELRPEVMDDPALPPSAHRHALRGLSRLNLLSGSAGILWPPIASFARRERGRLRVLDLACGAGDVPLKLWRKARRAGVEVEIHGLDVSSQAVSFARDQAEKAGAPVRFEERDVLNGPLPDDFDVLLCSLFLHHVDDAQAVRLLAGMRGAARRAVLINDLLRSTRGLLLAHIASRLFTSSEVVHADAPQSVRASFTEEEMLDLAREAGMEGARVSRHWPLRFLLTWRAH